MRRGEQKAGAGKKSDTADKRAEVALITGASSGIGRAMAFWFARCRPETELILTGRSQERLDRTAAALRKLGAVDVTCHAVDLAAEEGALQLYREVKQSGRLVSVLINNAGGNEAGLFRDLETAALKDLMRLNMEAPCLLASLFMPDLQKTQGRLLWVSSTGAFQPGPYTAVYYAAKAFIQSLAEALQFEEKNRVQVSILCPGTVHSDFSRRAGKADLAKGMMPAHVADYALPRFFKGKKRIIPGLQNRLAIFSSRLLPSSWLARIVAGIQGPLVSRGPRSGRSA